MEEDKKLYDHKLFVSLFDLCKFLNDGNIRKENIMSVFPRGEKIALVYYDRQEKRV